MVTASQYTVTILALEYIETVQLETDSSEITCVIAGHNLNDGDFVVNTTRRASTNLSGERGSRKVTVVDANTFTVDPEITNQAQNDNMMLFSFVDKTSYLKNKTLNINLRAEGKNEANFDIIV